MSTYVNMQSARVGQGLVGTLAALTGIARDVQTAQQALSSAWSQLSALRRGVTGPVAAVASSRGVPARIGQVSEQNRLPIATGTPFTCAHPYICELYNMFPDGNYGLVGYALSGSVVTAAPPSWYVPFQGQLIATNRMGNQILVRADTPQGPREGWTLAQYLRAYAAPVITPQPRRIDPRAPASERVFEREGTLRIPTEVLR